MTMASDLDDSEDFNRLDRNEFHRDGAERS